MPARTAKEYGDQVPSIEPLLIKRIQKVLLRWGRDNYSDFPWRHSINHFHALLAEVMLQRTRAEQVVPVFRAFASRYSSPFEASKEQEGIRNLVATLGLNWRGEKIIKLVETLKDLGGNIPTALEGLTSLPGVGTYAASSYLSLHAGIRMSIVDSNAVRLWGRIFGFKTDQETRRKRWFMELAQRVTPQNKFRDFNYAVLDFTRKVCRPKPLHDMCPLTSICKHYRRLHK